MVFLLLFVVAVVIVCRLTVWSWPTPVRAAADRMSPEGVLTAQLLTFRISPAQYRHAIEGIAARDGDRHRVAARPGTDAAEE
ncbi:hypothetical protein ACQPZX_28035 [Actinoplanes sp. CA-142083]|uniref:hypothetical protein n=1 Tax=Actinoplanes sp. CA-142083 TaxID=3239903 RepID=UPI003D8B4292